VAAFLTKYHGNGGQWQSLRDPLHAVTTKDEFSLITVEIDGYSYVVNDICMRMLRPHELAAAMGFPSWYRFELEDGTPLDEDDQVRMIGNACPVHTVKAIIKAVVLERPEAFGLVEAAS
jgi:DNA (cytosine-5)-methyltransferase 1